LLHLITEEISTDNVFVEIINEEENPKEKRFSLLKGKIKKFGKKKEKRDSKFKRLNSAFGACTLSDMVLF
jgi:hypothetical protein